MATIKRQLQRLLPGVRVFLDVDDLDDIANLEAHIQASAAALVYLGSVSYFGSPNCMREVCASKEANLPLVRVHESDMTKASASLAVLREACPGEHHDCLFDGGPIVEWCRVRDFQLVALAQIGQQLVGACGGEVGLRVSHTLPWAPLRFDAAASVRTSVHNAEAVSVVEALRARYPDLGASEEGHAAASWLVLLSAACFKGEDGAALAAEIESALRAGTPPVLVYAPDDGPFKSIIEATPRSLVELRLYDALAVEWRRGPLQCASEQLVAQKLGGRAGREWGGCAELAWWRMRPVRPGWVKTRSGLLIEPGQSLVRQHSQREASAKVGSAEVSTDALAAHDRL